jgi:hypothetical protein
MPQLDKVVYISNLLWMGIFLILIYILLVKILLVGLYKILVIREIIKLKEIKLKLKLFKKELKVELILRELKEKIIIEMNNLIENKVRVMLLIIKLKELKNIKNKLRLEELKYYNIKRDLNNKKDEN